MVLLVVGIFVGVLLIMMLGFVLFITRKVRIHVVFVFVEFLKFTVSL